MNPDLPKPPKKQPFSLAENLKYVLFLDLIMALVAFVCALASTGDSSSLGSNFLFALYDSAVVISLLAGIVSVILYFAAKNPNYSKIVLFAAILLLALAQVTCFGYLSTIA